MKKILFLTGTRADFGKIKSLISILELDSNFEVFVFVTGMHLLPEYGYTLIEIERCNFKNIFTFENHTHETTMDLTLAKTIEGLSTYCKTINPDLIVVHGDRVETLAGAIVGSLNNTLVAHIEGGELSGTVDELIRHSVSKLSHIHFVSSHEAAKRLYQMGEIKSSVYTIGSPDLDILFSDSLPNLEVVKKYYNIDFENFALLLFHPVTTEIELMSVYANNLTDVLLNDTTNYVVIYPNNDLGSQTIISSFERFKGNTRFRVFPSLRFEYFLTLLKHSKFIIGNSSSGVREAPFYNIPVINIGTRQQNRIVSNTILNVDYKKESISKAIKNIESYPKHDFEINLGKGNSDQLFLECLKNDDFWQTNHQKQFRDNVT